MSTMFILIAASALIAAVRFGLLPALCPTGIVSQRHRQAVVGVGAFLMVFAGLSSPVFAQEAEPSGTGLESITLSALTVQLLVAAVIPIVTGVVTKASLSSFVKGLITLVLNALNAAIVQATVADGGAFFSQETIVATLIGLTISVATYLGVYKPANLTSSAGGRLAPSTGIGPTA